MLEILKDLIFMVKNNPSLPTKDYVRLLNAIGYNVDKSVINSIFYKNKVLFQYQITDTTKRLWYLKEEALQVLKIDEKDIGIQIIKNTIDIENIKEENCLNCAFSIDKSCSRAFFNIRCDQYRQV